MPTNSQLVLQCGVTAPYFTRRRIALALREKERWKRQI
jgi:hypothetical protein